MTNSKRYTITAALPYTNGPVHIGHLAGVYVPADIYARFLRATGNDVIYICGSDEHGVPITIKAKKEGVSPQDVVDKYHAIIKKSFSDFGISFDNYSDKFLGWFKSRGISKQTLVSNRVAEGLEYMPQVDKEVTTIQFKYYRDSLHK